MRSYRAKNNQVAVSANAMETAINTEQTMNLSIATDMESLIVLEQRRENNANEATGLEETDQIYDNGAMSSGSWSFSKAQPQHFALILSYALGKIATTTAGTGYLHTITPIDGDADEDRSNPSFTAMQRLGETVLKRRFVSMFVDGFTASFKKDDWVGLSADIKGTGKFVDNVNEESITAAKNATTLTLATNAVEGSTAAERLDSVHAIKVELTSGIWTDVAFSAVSSATPAAITITAPGGTSDNVTYKVLYVPDEAAAFTFPARVQETPLRVSELTVNFGGSWSGSAFTGGRTMSSEINSIEWKFANNMEIEFVPGSGGAYASGAFRGGREQTVTIDRKMRDFIMQQHVIDNDEFGLRILCEGAVYDSPHKYQVEIIFPQCAILKANPKVDDKRLGEDVEVQVMEHSTYGSVIVKVKNLQAAYMA